MQVALELSATPDFQKNRTDPHQNEPTAILNYHSNEQASQSAGTSRIVSSAEYTSGGIKQHKLRATSLVFATLIFCFAAAFYFARVYHKDKVSSIAVLPFVNASGDQNSEYLSDGISESIIYNLSKIPNVKVIARSSSFQFKGKETDYVEAANTLGVQAIVAGRVTQLGDQLVVSVEMINAMDGSQTWGEQYSRNTSKLIQIQSEISQDIAGKLRVKLTGEQQIGKSELATNPHAYELLLKDATIGTRGNGKPKQSH